MEGEDVPVWKAVYEARNGEQRRVPYQRRERHREYKRPQHQPASRDVPPLPCIWQQRAEDPLVEYEEQDAEDEHDDSADGEQNLLHGRELVVLRHGTALDRVGRCCGSLDEGLRPVAVRGARKRLRASAPNGCLASGLVFEGQRESAGVIVFGGHAGGVD